MKEFVSAIEESEVDETEEEKFVPFKVDGKELHAYAPHEGQLLFMMANLGRGQNNESRLAAMVNIMLSSLRDEDRDYLESRLLERDRKKRLDPKVIEGVFEFLVEEWFGTPTKQPSDSAPSLPSDGQN